MDAKQASRVGPAESAVPTQCLRLQRYRTVEEHLDCPYCSGNAAAVESGERSRFCDFEPGADPVAFGFPEGTQRSTE